MLFGYRYIAQEKRILVEGRQFGAIWNIVAQHGAGVMQKAMTPRSQEICEF